MAVRLSKVSVIGSGFAGLSAAAVLASKGCEVEVLEKNNSIGGRARSFESDGFVFDMGPSWYWMPDVFEKFYNQFNHTASDFYDLKKLDPGFSIIFGKSEVFDVPADFDSLCALFESLEKGASLRLQQFMVEAEYKYNVGMHDLVYEPGLSISEYFKLKLIKGAFKLQVFTSFSKHVRSYFKHPKLIALLEFPVLFLGATPQNTPALYSLMNFAGLKVGTFYPMGGFSKVIEAFQSIAQENGVSFKTSATVDQLEINNEKISHIHINGSSKPVDAVIGSADYHHIEQHLLQKKDRSYSEAYWESRVFAPSCLIFYLGVDKIIPSLNHHNLFFDADLEKHASEIYSEKKWPTDPLFYVCCPSKTDPKMAPQGKENLFVLMPIATGLKDSEETKDLYYQLIMNRLEDFTGQKIKDHVIFKRSYAVSDFIKDYNAYKGNAYGLANTLMQTGILKPKIRHKKVKNLFYAGQLTVPGPGVPPSIISGQVAANQMLNYLKNL